jgi:hypothetical protein
MITDWWIYRSGQDQKRNLEMVCGADTLLDKLSNQGVEVVCKVSEIPVENFDLLEYL